MPSLPDTFTKRQAIGGGAGVLAAGILVGALARGGGSTPDAPPDAAPIGDRVPLLEAAPADVKTSDLLSGPIGPGDGDAVLVTLPAGMSIVKGSITPTGDAIGAFQLGEPVQEVGAGGIVRATVPFKNGGAKALRFTATFHYGVIP